MKKFSVLHFSYYSITVFSSAVSGVIVRQEKGIKKNGAGVKQVYSVLVQGQEAFLCITSELYALPSPVMIIHDQDVTTFVVHVNGCSGHGQKNIPLNSRGALVAVHNDDALLGASPNAGHDAVSDESAVGYGECRQQRENAGNEVLQPGNEYAVPVTVDMAALFARDDGAPEREIPLAAFSTIFTDDTGLSVEDLRAALNSTARVWTWTRLKERVEKAGMHPDSAALALGLVDSLPEYNTAAPCN